MSGAQVLDFKPQKRERRRILFADAAPLKFESLIRWLKKEHFYCESFSSIDKFMERVKAEPIDICVVNLLMGGGGSFKMIERIRKESKNKDIRIVVLSKQIQKVNIQNSIRAGANDFVADPFETANLFNRLIFQLAPKKEIQNFKPDEKNIVNVKGAEREYFTLLIDAIDILAHNDRLATNESFFEILSRLAKLLDSNRTNLVIVESGESDGLILASSDDPDFTNFKVSLEKYPEISSVVTTGSIILVEDISANKLTSDIQKKVESIDIGSMMVFPIFFQDEIDGAITIRRSQVKSLPSMEVLTIIQAIANTLAGHAHTAVALKKLYKNYDAAAK